MAMTIFYLLNGMGVVFLLYVLASFWKEGHQPKNDDRKFASEFRQREWASVFIATHPISHSAQGGVSVIPFQARDRGFSGKPAARTSSSRTQEMPVRRVSTR
jgi:hypothetical protein